MQENVPKGLYYDTANAYVRSSVPSPPFRPISIPNIDFLLFAQFPPVIINIVKNREDLALVGNNFL